MQTYAVLPSMAGDAAALEARTAVAAGFDTLKAKVGGGDLDADLRALAAVREAVDPNIRVIADYNQSLPFVAQSFAGWPYAREGGPVKTEEHRLDPQSPPELRTTLDAIRYLETAVTRTRELAGVALRYGGFYGPGTSLRRTGVQTEMVRRRRFPIIGDGNGIWSLVHIDDVATATAKAVEHGEAGVYNITDDDPAPVRAWLPYLAEILGAKPPRHLPLWVGRLMGGEHTVALMTSVRGASNAKAKRMLGWVPRYPSWRTGFKELELGA